MDPPRSPPDAQPPRGPEAAGAQPGRIQELVRTYVFLNDPKVRQLTMKFLIMVAAMTPMFAVAYIAITADDTSPPAFEGADEAAMATPDGARTCMSPTEYEAWQEQNPGVEVTDLDRGAAEVCVTYEP